MPFWSVASPPLYSLSDAVRSATLLVLSWGGWNGFSDNSPIPIWREFAEAVYWFWPTRKLNTFCGLYYGSLSKAFLYKESFCIFFSCMLLRESHASTKILHIVEQASAVLAAGAGRWVIYSVFSSIFPFWCPVSSDGWHYGPFFYWQFFIGHFSRIISCIFLIGAHEKKKKKNAGNDPRKTANSAHPGISLVKFMSRMCTLGAFSGSWNYHRKIPQRGHPGTKLD